MSARYKPYPEYRDSGVEWLGEIPAGWEMRRLKWLASVQLSNVDKKSEEGEERVKLCNYTDVYYNERITPGMEFMSAMATREQTKRFSLRAGDVLITKDSESWTDIAVPAVVTEGMADVLCGYHLAQIRPTTECVGAFLSRAFSAIGPRDQFQVAANGITRFGLGGDAIRTGLFAMPPEPEQRAIAAFLDRLTAQIDALIDKMERLIELLEEQRTALITRAVTKGLDPDVPMKDSGVEWLGEIPAHWDVTSSKRLFGHRKERAHDGDEQLTASQKYGVLTQADFMELERQRVVQVVIGESILKHVEAGDFVISMRSFQGGLELARVSCRISSAYQILYPLRLVDDGYYKWLFKSAQYVQALQSTSNLVRDGQALRYSNFAQVALPTPPLQEQGAIGAWLDRDTGRIDNLADTVSRAIGRFREYRIALISAAVTGKIDVRDEVAA